MDNNGRKKFRETVAALRRHLETELDGEAAWSWSMRLGLAACMEARGVGGETPAFLEFACGTGAPSPALQAKGRALLAECRDLLTRPEALGWLHQYWHDGERASIAEARAGQNAKVAAASLVPATQVYSEDYMVDFLVENSLGALWHDSHPASFLPASWRYYVRSAVRPAASRPHSAASLTVCDPACGAGHFLLRAFELLYTMCREEDGAGDPAAACAAILNNNLFGMDIDGRAVAVARAVLWLRAKELAPRLAGDLPGLSRHIVAAGETPTGELGSLQSAAEAGEPLASLLGRRYAVVLANPPYLDKRDYGKTVRAHLRTHYPAGAGNLYAAFILRCLELADDYAAMVTPQTFLFIRSYAALRQTIFAQAAIRTLAQLGLGAFSEAVVDAALFVLAKGGAADTPGVYLRLTAVGDKAASLPAAAVQANRRQEGSGVYIRPQATATALPGQPVIYWLGDGLRAMLAGAAPLKDMADVVLGMKTSDNKRFVRLWWELQPPDGGEAAGWAVYEKEASGHRYARAAAHYVRWTAAAQHYYQNHYSAQLPNPGYWFRPGLAYGLISSKAFAAKLLPAGQMTDMAASCVFPGDAADTHFLLGLLNAKIYQWLLKSLNPTVNYQPVDLQRLPVPRLPAADKAAVGRWAAMAADAAGQLRAGGPADRGYRLAPGEYLPLTDKLPQRLLAMWRAALAYVLAADAIDRRLAAAMRLPAEEQAAIYSELGASYGDLPGLAGYDRLPPWLPAEAELRPAKTISPPAGERATIIGELRRAYEAGPLRGELPETFFGRLAASTRLHPVTIYNIIEAGVIEAGVTGGGWHCRPLTKNLVEDFFSAVVLAHLGHTWPGRQPPVAPLPVIPLTAGASAPPLIDIIEEYLARYGDPAETAAAFAAIVGSPLAEWLAREFFPRHCRQFRKRPVAWQITSNPGRGGAAFACLVHCRQTAGLAGAIERLIAPLTVGEAADELAAFRRRLAVLTDYAPAPDYGVRVNIAPLQAAGLLAANVLGPEEVPPALADGGRCRQGDYIL